MERRDERQHQQGQGQGQAQSPASRLHLNLGFVGNQHQNLTAEAARQFPTTPSTFPQPVFPNQYGQRETWGAQTPSQQNNYGNMNYFMQHPVPPNAGLAQPISPSGSYRSQNAHNDGTNGLAQQFSHQNLGGTTPRGQSPYRPQPNGQRPGVGSRHGSNLVPQNPTFGGAALYEEELPQRQPEKYADNVYKRAKASQNLVAAFFKENVQRARERNQRSVSFYA